MNKSTDGSPWFVTKTFASVTLAFVAFASVMFASVTFAPVIFAFVTFVSAAFSSLKTEMTKCIEKSKKNKYDFKSLQAKAVCLTRNFEYEALHFDLKDLAGCESW